MPNTIKFIDTIIRNLQPTSKRQLLWCYGCPCFGIRVTPSGAKTFIFKYMVSLSENKRTSRWITIGKYPEWTIRKARTEYDRLYELVHEYGRDPVSEKKAEEERLNSTYTTSEFIEVYLEYCRLKGKSSVKEEERVFNLDIIPLMGKKNINEVTSEDIDKIQYRILKRAKNTANASRHGKVTVKNTLAYTRQLFNLAKRKKLIDNNPVMEVESLGVSGSRSRILNFNEIWIFWNRIEELVPPVTAKALKYEIVTMQRSKEVRNMLYSAYRPNENVWHMEKEDTKNKKMHRVPLNRYAREIIKDIEAYTGASPYVFGATKVLSPPKIQNINLKPLGITALPQAINRNRKNLGIEDFCPHDLRRTGATWITAVGLPKLYARFMLNHSDGERDVTGEVYIQYSYDFEKKRAAQVWEFILDQIVTCPSLEDIPTLDELRERVKDSGLL